MVRRFVAVNLTFRGMNMALLWMFVDGFGVHYLIGSILVAGILYFAGYVSSRAYIFKEPAKPCPSCAASSTSLSQEGGRHAVS